MIRPGVTFVLWLAIALFVLLNDAVGDTWIGATLPVRAVEWYKAQIQWLGVLLFCLLLQASLSPSQSSQRRGCDQA